MKITILILICQIIYSVPTGFPVDCDNLLMGQYPFRELRSVMERRTSITAVYSNSKSNILDSVSEIISELSLFSKILNSLRYICLEARIDNATQQPVGCKKNNKAKVNCSLAEGLVCRSSNLTTYEGDVDCKYTNGKSFETALLLSIFLGAFGVDRFYLGYPALGLLKLCTLGFMFLGQLIDIILIATQVVGPADGSHYIISYYGPGVTVLKMNNETYKVPQDDW